jgi:DNA-directed RNA polymerase specialized sigma24 family protein
MIEFFEKAIAIPELIESKQREIKRLKTLAYSLSAVNTEGERVQTSRNTQCKYAELINKATDLEIEILDDTSEMLDYQREVGKLIDKLSDPMLKLVMRDLYIDGLTITEVAKRRNYSERRIYSFRDLALEECKKFHTISE